MYYNKRLHPRQPPVYVEHRTGCVLREFAPMQISRHSSMSSLDARPRRRLTSTGSTTSGSTTNLTAPPIYSRRDYCRPSSVADSITSSVTGGCPVSSVADSDDSTASYSGRPHAPASRKVSENSLKSVSFSGDCVDREGYDSPQSIIASLFPESVQRSGSAASKSTRKGSVDSYLNRSATSSATSTTTRRVPTSAAATAAQKRKSLYRPDSLLTLDRDFQSLKYAML